MGMRITDIAFGRATFEMTPAEFRLQPLGVVHGGNIATLIDTATFWACYVSMGSDEDGLASVDLKLNYLAPARVEAPVVHGHADQGWKDVVLRRSRCANQRRAARRARYVDAHATAGPGREARDSVLGRVTLSGTSCAPGPSMTSHDQVLDSSSLMEAKDIMKARIDLMHVNPGVIKAMLGLERQVRQAGFDHKLLDLVRMRASQINGCAYCLDMHSKDARANGETEQRLYGLDAWRETPYYSSRERAALEWTEALTLVSETRVPGRCVRARAGTVLGGRARAPEPGGCGDQRLELAQRRCAHGARQLCGRQRRDVARGELTTAWSVRRRTEPGSPQFGARRRAPPALFRLKNCRQCVDLTLHGLSVRRGQRLREDALERRAMRGMPGDVFTDDDIGLNAFPLPVRARDWVDGPRERDGGVEVRINA